MSWMTGTGLLLGGIYFLPQKNAYLCLAGMGWKCAVWTVTGDSTWRLTARCSSCPVCLLCLGWLAFLDPRHWYICLYRPVLTWEWQGQATREWILFASWSSRQALLEVLAMIGECGFTCCWPNLLQLATWGSTTTVVGIFCWPVVGSPLWRPWSLLLHTQGELCLKFVRSGEQGGFF